MEKGTIFITGGAKRVGKAIALALAEHGHSIALHYNSSKDAADQTANKIRSKGVECNLFSYDLMDTKNLNNLISDVFLTCPDCNVLINNASIFERHSFLDSNEDIFDNNFDLHVKTPFFLSQSFANKCDVGLIINMLDTKVHRTVTEYFVYTLSKKTFFEFTKMAAKTLAPNIRVNGIAPGYILPPIDGSEPDEVRVQKSIPLQMLGNPDLIANTVLYLLNNPFITGECITVDGGEKLK